jgi:uncharacterized tellurite resistance protein B-like protein
MEKRRRSILDRLAGRLKAEEEGRQGFRREQVAAAALLVECARVDRKIPAEERALVCTVVREHFGLDAETSEALIEVAEKQTKEVWDDWLFLEAIKQGFSEQERIELLGGLWEVAYIDGRMHPFEEHLIGRIASELGIPGSEVERTRAHAWTRINESQGKPGK